MTTQAISVRRPDNAFPHMLFISMLGHLLVLVLVIALPELLPAGKREPFGGQAGSGLNVVGVVDFNLGKKGPTAAKPKTQEEPAPALFLKKKSEDVKPLESKTAFPEDKPKKEKEQPAATKSINVPQNQRKMEGPYGAGTDKSKDAGKSGTSGAGKFGLSTGGAGQGNQGAGSGAGVPFPFPWYVENILTKIELNWSRPYIQEITPQVYTCVVYFVITRTGQVKDVQVEHSSGITALDRSAESAVLGSSPLPPLPNQWTEPDLPFRLTFSYSRE